MLSTIFLVMAIIGTTVLVIQTIFLFIGLAEGGDMEMHFDGDVDADTDFPDGDTGLRLITVRGIVAFFAIGGWLGYGLADTVQPVWSILFSIIAGFAGLVIVGVIFHFALKLQSDGTLSLESGIGKTGEVYLPIGANNTKVGKITVEIQGRVAEYDAVTEGDTTLKVGTLIRITGMKSSNIFLVEQVV